MKDDAIPQHKMMAMGKGIMSDETFGTESPFKSAEMPEKGKTLKDGERGISKPRGYHPQPDHGDPELGGK